LVQNRSAPLGDIDAAKITRFSHELRFVSNTYCPCDEVERVCGEEGIVAQAVSYIDGRKRPDGKYQGPDGTKLSVDKNIFFSLKNPPNPDPYAACRINIGRSHFYELVTIREVLARRVPPHNMDLADAFVEKLRAGEFLNWTLVKAAASEAKNRKEPRPKAAGLPKPGDLAAQLEAEATKRGAGEGGYAGRLKVKMRDGSVDYITPATAPRPEAPPPVEDSGLPIALRREKRNLPPPPPAPSGSSETESESESEEEEEQPVKKKRRDSPVKEGGEEEESEEVGGIPVDITEALERAWSTGDPRGHVTAFMVKERNDYHVLYEWSEGWEGQKKRLEKEAWEAKRMETLAEQNAAEMERHAEGAAMAAEEVAALKVRHAAAMAAKQREVEGLKEERDYWREVVWEAEQEGSGMERFIFYAVRQVRLRRTWSRVFSTSEAVPQPPPPVPPEQEQTPERDGGRDLFDDMSPDMSALDDLDI
jgi:hypothetical protein